MTHFLSLDATTARLVDIIKATERVGRMPQRCRINGQETVKQVLGALNWRMKKHRGSAVGSRCTRDQQKQQHSKRSRRKTLGLVQVMPTAVTATAAPRRRVYYYVHSKLFFYLNCLAEYIQRKFLKSDSSEFSASGISRSDILVYIILCRKG